jgi:hypothetical protein
MENFMIIDELQEFLQKYKHHIEYPDRSIGKGILEKSIKELKENKETIETLQNKIEDIQISNKEMSEKLKLLELKCNVEILIKNFNLLAEMAYEYAPPRKYSKLDEVVHSITTALDQKIE